ncbi:MAG: aminopeptidase P family N-terminal domain-containing protein, partial [Sandaracinaceae bacterium]|nr:aminopeptidase P family N-terminal domain-containing protein [Sandaracinaceae bacterium]
MRDRDDMLFPRAEHERRLRELRERMEAWKLDVVVITDPENLFYLTEYQTTGYSYFQALVVPLEGEPYMVTRKLEETNVVARTWVSETRPYSDTGDAIETLWHALREFGHIEGKRIGYERNSYFFPAYQQDRMTASWYEADFVDCFGIVEEGRLIKS